MFLERAHSADNIGVRELAEIDIRLPARILLRNGGRADCAELERAPRTPRHRRRDSGAIRPVGGESRPEGATVLPERLPMFARIP